MPSRSTRLQKQWRDAARITELLMLPPRDKKSAMRERKWQAKPGARRGQDHRGDRRREWRRETKGEVVLYGWHTVIAALTNPARRIHRLLATENALRRLAEEGIAPPVEPELMRPDALAARLTPDAVHQGLIVEADPLPSPAIEDLPASGTVLVLDQITDPHNVGAILRTAAAFAVSAVITTARHSPEATGVLAKSASGALELVPIVLVQNLARALGALKLKLHRACIGQLFERSDQVLDAEQIYAFAKAMA